MKKIFFIILFNLFIFTNSYALVTFGSEKINITTKPSLASCKLKNDKGSWSITTPEIVKLKKSKKPLVITCSKEGYEKFKGTYSLQDVEKVPNSYLEGVLIGDPVDATAGVILSIGTNLTRKFGTYSTHMIRKDKISLKHYQKTIIIRLNIKKD